MKTILNQFNIGDMNLIYFHDTDTNLCGMTIIPADMPFDDLRDNSRRSYVHSLVQAKFIGDFYSSPCVGGETMLMSESSSKLTYQDQRYEKNGNTLTIRTYLKNNINVEAVHTVSYTDGDKFITINTELINNSGGDIKCEMLSSFVISNISPYLDGCGEESLILHRLRSKWSTEGRLVSESFENLQLEEFWIKSPRCKSLRFGQVGSMPVRGYFPFMAVEDKKNNVLWGVQMGCPSSWQMEIMRSDDCADMVGGIADREFGHWMKTIKAGETFSSIAAVVSVCCSDIDDLSQRLTSAQEKNLKIPSCEEDLPIIFNEFCTTWGDPSHENIKNIVNAITGKGIDYFVIDCGWYREDGIPWDEGMGEYIPSPTLFPYGISKTVEEIKRHGMKAGIWFEFENVGSKCKIFNDTKHMLKRDGITLTTTARRFWDMTDPWVKEYLNHKVIDFMLENGFEYIKVDYNDTIGLGCDHPDSLGEGLRENQLATTDFFKRIQERIPDVVIENCASGGHRLEPTFMGLSSMASFSDAHECVEIPIIAANLHRAILPRQSQIWCVIRESDDIKRIAYSIIAGTLGRLCLSGDVTNLSSEQWDMIEKGIDFYKKSAPIIKNGKSHIYRYTNESYRHPQGWQAVVRTSNSKTLVTIHTFGGDMPQELHIKIPHGMSVVLACSHNEPNVSIYNDKLTLMAPDNYSGYGLILQSTK